MRHLLSIFHFVIFIVFYISTYRDLKTLQLDFRGLKRQEKGDNYNENNCKQQGQEICEVLKRLTESEVR